MKRELKTKIPLVLGRVVAGLVVVATVAVSVPTFGELTDPGPAARTTAATAPSALPLVPSGQGRDAEAVAKPAPQPQPRLQGAKPTFRAQPESAEAGKAARSADPIAAERTPTAGGSADLEPSASASAPDSAAAATISSVPKGSAATAADAVAGRTATAADPTALEVAREFAQGFVAYETGGERGDFQDLFKRLATPELRKALMERPPKQPAGAEVPRAKVLNVVAGPTRAGVQRVSVSLLRVTVTSELRLDLKKLGAGKDAEWRVANVLG